MSADRELGDLRYDMEQAIQRVDRDSDEAYKRLDRDLDEMREDLCADIDELRTSLRDAWTAIVELRKKVAAQEVQP